MSMSREQIIDYYYETREYRLAPLGLKQHVRRSSLSSGAKICFDFLLDAATFSDDWSTQVSRADIAGELRNKPNSITRLLLELEKAGYIIRKLNPSKASTIYINFPEDAIAALEVSNIRRSKRKAIQECGTIIDQSQPDGEKMSGVSNFRSQQKRVDDLPKIVSPTLYNTKQYNNNNTMVDLVNQDQASSNKSVVVSSHDNLASSVLDPEPIATSVLSTKLSDLDSQISSLSKLIEFEKSTKSQAQVGALQQELSLLEADRFRLLSNSRPSSSVGYDEGLVAADSSPMGKTKRSGDSCSTAPLSSAGDLSEPVGDPSKEDEKKDLRQKISELDVEIAKLSSMEGVGDDNASKHEALMRLGKVEADRFSLNNKLSALSKRLKPASMQLEHGDRKLTGDDLQKIKGVLGAAVKAKEISVCDARQTLKSMVQSILHGYYASEGVCIAKSVNSVIKKFKSSNGWSNSIEQDNKPSRSQPPLWKPSSSNRIDFRGIVKNINSKNIVARRLS